MNFHSAQYAVFLCVVFAAFWAARDWRVLRGVLLLVGSYVFYAGWNELYLLLIVGSTLLDYYVGGALARTSQDRRARRKTLVTTSVVANLGLLAVFKYYGFFRDNVEATLGAHLPELDVLLPVGISFYTFQSLSYTIDIYRGTLQPARGLVEFALYVAFFPQLVAGPIVRASTFLPQLDHRPALGREDLHRGLERIGIGLVKKVAVADVLAVALVDPVFADGSTLGGFAALLGVYAYALQIYCDFSGYSDIAIGSARLFGFEIPENFRRPYLATSIQDFWRRWHISLSTWLRDYLYIPLGGNRGGRWSTLRNLALTMLLGGLWHGAAWNFVLWGGLHGLWLAVGRIWPRVFSRVPLLGPLCAGLVTFHLVCFAWVFFRAGASFDLALDVLARIAGGGDLSLPSLAPGVVVALLLGLATHLLPRSLERRCSDLLVATPSWAVGAALTLLFGALAWAEVGGVPFIYFQF